MNLSIKNVIKKTTTIIATMAVTFSGVAYSNNASAIEVPTNENYPAGFTVDESGIATISATAPAVTSETLMATKKIKKFKVEDNPNYVTSEDGASLISSATNELIRYASANHESNLYKFPQTLTKIDDYGCECAMDTVGFVVPSGVQSIGNYGFYAGGNILRILFDEKTDASHLTTVGNYAFAYNDNLEISLPPSVTQIGEYAFAFCSNLREKATLTEEYSNVATSAGIIARTNITAVPAYCFYKCPNLHYVDLPATVKTIGAYAFSGCVNMDTVNFSGSTLDSVGTGAFQGNGNLHKISIPEGVTTIEASTFEGCQNLNTIHLPETLTTISDNAFSNCNNIHEMNIPASVTYISPSAFANVTNTDGIDTSANPYASVLLGKATSVCEPGTRFAVGKYTYKVLTANASGGSVMLMGYKDAKTKKAQNPRTLKVVSKVKYLNCDFNVVSIKSGAFKGCKKLKKIVITNQKTIGAKAFYGCKGVRRVTITGKALKKVGGKAFYGTHKKAVIKVPKAKKKAYTKLLKNKGIKKIR
ncbi:MAG: leucine-rich repeat domain-containing protein [Lachnospiraceae bacterium]|nr:leucine-rich repeat domain-containing protein [Lachnospiraceae bacterium]